MGLIRLRWLSRAALRDVAAVVGADARVALLATAQGGVVSREEAFALSLSADEIRTRLRLGRWRTLHRGVYAVGHEAVGLRGRAIAALLAAPAGAVLSHRMAAAVWDVWRGEPPAEVTVTRGASVRRGTLTVHSTRTNLTPRVKDGLPLTSPERTCLDLAGVLRPAELRRVIREARVAGLVTDDSLRAEAARAKGHHGTAPLLRALAGGAEPTRSRTERAFLRLIRDAGLPKPESDVRMDGIVADFLWPRQRVIVETDAFATHGDRTTFESDRARDAALQVRGYRTLRFTRSQVRDEPLRVLATLAAVLNG